MKRVLFIGLIIFLNFFSIAGSVDSLMTKKVALNWYENYAPDLKKRAEISNVKEYKWNDRTSFYIYSFDQGGFVLVAANDAVSPVLGYGFDQNTPNEITNEAVKRWFDGYARQIDTAFVLNLSSNKAKMEWDDILSNNFPRAINDAVDPLLTTQWGQGWPYNELCPHNYPVGCNATAMAQVINFWEFPNVGYGHNNYFSYQDSISVDYTISNYYYDSLENNPNTSCYTLSQLLYDCGTSVSMQYAGGGSASYFCAKRNAMINRFSYSGDMELFSKNYTVDSIWNSLLINELDNGRPVLYAGGTHAWVCDGYDNEYFHFNWGWQGLYDGYYLTDNLNPGGANYNSYIEMYINIYPDSINNIKENTSWSGFVELHNNTYVLDDYKLTIAPGTTIEADSGCKIQVFGTINAVGNQSDSIVFTAADSTHGWDGIDYLQRHLRVHDGDLSATFMNNNDSSVFQYCILERYKNNGGIISNASPVTKGVVKITGFDKIKIQKCSIKLNDNAINGYGGAGISTYVANILIEANTFEGNTGFQGSGIIMRYSNNTIINNLFINNTSTYSAPAIYISSCDSSYLANNKFISNINTNSYGPGAIHFYRSNPILINNFFYSNQGVHGGAIGMRDSSPKFFNNTFLNNSSFNGGAIHIDEGASPEFYNTIFYGNSDITGTNQIHIVSLASLILSNSILEGGINDIAGTGSGNNFVGQINNCYDQYPDLIIDSVENTYYLPDSSICINAGIPVYNSFPSTTLDLNDSTRIFGGIIDIGAVENQNITPAPQIVTDIDSISISIPLNTLDSCVVKLIPININNFNIEDITIFNNADYLSTLVKNDTSLVIYANNSSSGEFYDTISILYDTLKTNIIVHSYFGSEYISGIINDTISSDTVYVIGDIFIPDGEDLVIMPGTNIIFNGYYQILVEGQLQVLGQPEDTVVFTINDTTGYNYMSTKGAWNGIRFKDIADNNDTSRINYASFNHTKAFLQKDEGCGGAIEIYNSDKVLINGCRFTHNKAVKNGGAVYSEKSVCNIRNSIFENNFALSYGSGGALYSYPGYHELTIIENCSFENNYARWGGGVYIPNAYSPIIINSSFNNNRSDFGGALEIGATDIFMANNIFTNNYSTREGGAIYISSNNLVGTLLNNTFLNNSTAGAGGAIYSPSYLKLNIINNIFWGNQSTLSGNQISIDGTTDYFSIINSIIEDGLNGISCEGSFTGNYENNLNEDPLLFMVNSQYVFNNNSPCFNNGISDTTGLYISDFDIYGNPRIQYDTIDIGAYEYGVPLANFQEIELSQGWNIFSCNVTPSERNMLSVLNSLIESSQFIKTIDESGGFVQNIPGAGWLNTIGNMENTEGYYIKTTENSSLSLVGTEINLPIDLPLQTGWNIMGYPMKNSQDAITALQPLINNSHLYKVINESGGFIQELPEIGWINTIGNLEGGEGYYIKLTADDTLVLHETGKKFAGPIYKPKEGNFYQRTQSGNPYLPMHVISTFNDSLQLLPGDELAVFVDDLCIGSTLIEETLSYAITYLNTNDPLTPNKEGGDHGDPLSFKLLHQGLEYELEALNVGQEDLVYESLSTKVLKFTSEGLSIETPTPIEFRVSDPIPNPANGRTSIQISSQTTANLNMELVDINGRTVKVFNPIEILLGAQSVELSTQDIPSGLYFIQMEMESIGGFQRLNKKLVIQKN